VGESHKLSQVQSRFDETTSTTRVQKNLNTYMNNQQRDINSQQRDMNSQQRDPTTRNRSADTRTSDLNVATYSESTTNHFSKLNAKFGAYIGSLYFNV